MKRFFAKKILIFFLIAIVLGFSLVPSSTYANLITKALLRQIDTTTVFVSVRDPDLAFIGLRTRELLVRPKSSLFGLSLKEVRIVPLFSDLLRGRVTLKVTGRWLQGDLSLLWQPNEDTISLSLVGTELHRFPFFQGLGFQGGILNTELTDLAFRRDGSLRSVKNLTIALSDISKPRPSSLPPALLGLPLEVSIPRLSETSLQLSLRTAPLARGASAPGEPPLTAENDEQLIIEEAKLLSNLGELSGSGTTLLRSPHHLDLNFTGTLKKPGFRLLEDPIKLFSSGKITGPDQPFTTIITGPLRPIPLIKITPKT
ncbi:hypothetical protein MRY87_13415 [bacterium]|nr:hypothetical protein [bacterium]